MEYLTDLINAALLILDNGLDAQALVTWKEVSLVCLVGLYGPFHFYTQNFRKLTLPAGPLGLLAGKGVLEAAKLEISGKPRTAKRPAVHAVVNKERYRDKLRKLLAQLQQVQTSTDRTTA
jgi:hypothetical protein